MFSPPRRPNHSAIPIVRFRSASRSGTPGLEILTIVAESPEIGPVKAFQGQRAPGYRRTPPPGRGKNSRNIKTYALGGYGRREIFVDRQQERAEAGSGGQIVMHEWVLWVVINYGVPSSGTSIK